VNLKGKSFVVTGGASGIGKACARHLAQLGASVRIGDRDTAGGEAVAGAARAEGLDMDFMELDLEIGGSIDQFIAAAISAHVGVDGLVNCAGWDAFDQPFLLNDPKQWERVIQINLLGPMRLTQGMLRPMQQRRAGRIVNISSEAGRVGTALHCAYTAAKGGMIALTKALAREFGSSQITVNCIAPGPIETPFMRRAIRDADMSAMVAANPIQRVGDPDDIARAVAFFLDAANSYITGQTLSVSGGMTMIG
jgi:2-hydroxycyclohexanecarboxyl-CoA dehydrogenase